MTNGTFNSGAVGGAAGFAAAVTGLRPTITLDLGDGVHTAQTLDGVYSVLIDLAKKLKSANDTLYASEISQAFIAARLKFGAAMVQLREQIPHGRWGQLSTELAHRVGVSTHTLKQAIRVAARLATEQGSLDPAKVAKAEAVLAALANKSHPSNGARAHDLKPGSEAAAPAGFGRGRVLPDEEYRTEAGSNGARAHDLDSPLPSMRRLEELGRALARDEDEEDDFADGIGDLEPIVIEEDPASAGVLISVAGSAGGIGGVGEIRAGTLVDADLGASGLQLGFADLVLETRSAVERLEESAEGADPAAAHAIATELHAAADRIVARATAPASPANPTSPTTSPSGTPTASSSPEARLVGPGVNERAATEGESKD